MTSWANSLRCGALTGLCALGLAACGGGAGARAPGRSAQNASPRLAASAASVRAQAINLVPTELSGYHAQPPDTRLWEVQAEALYRCLRPRSPLPPAPPRPSEELTGAPGLQGAEVSSAVLALGSSAAAQRLAQALSAQRAGECWGDAVRASLQAQSALHLAQSVQVTALPLAPAGARGAFAYRMALTATPTAAGQAQYTVYADVGGFAYARAVIELETISARALFPPVTERRLLELLLQRARSSIRP